MILTEIGDAEEDFLQHITAPRSKMFVETVFF
jgi:hypothetical protein